MKIDNKIENKTYDRLMEASEGWDISVQLPVSLVSFLLEHNTYFNESEKEDLVQQILKQINEQG